MTDCNHTFAWWGVVPPTHCPCCGACLHCGAPRPVPVMPAPWPYRPASLPWWQQGPYYSTTVHTSNVTSGGTPLNATTYAEKTR